MRDCVIKDKKTSKLRSCSKSEELDDTFLDKRYLLRNVGVGRDGSCLIKYHKIPTWDAYSGSPLYLVDSSNKKLIPIGVHIGVHIGILFNHPFIQKITKQSQNNEKDDL